MLTLGDAVIAGYVRDIVEALPEPIADRACRRAVFVGAGEKQAGFTYHAPFADLHGRVLVGARGRPAHVERGRPRARAARGSPRVASLFRRADTARRAEFLAADPGNQAAVDSVVAGIEFEVRALEFVLAGGRS